MLTEGQSTLIPRDKRFSSIVSSRCGLKWAREDIKKKLNPRREALLRESCFGTLILDTKAITFSGTVIHSILLRQMKEQHAGRMDFKIGNEVLSFTLSDFAEIIGLNVDGPTSLNAFEGRHEVSNLERKYFSSKNGKVSMKQLVDTYRRTDMMDDIDFVKLSNLFFLETVVLGNRLDLNVQRSHLHLADSLDVFNNFGWGRIAFDTTLSSLRKSLVKCGEGWAMKDGYELAGFTLALQVWAYERIPCIRQLSSKREATIGFPLIIKWSSKRSPQFVDVDSVLENLEVSCCSNSRGRSNTDKTRKHNQYARVPADIHNERLCLATQLMSTVEALAMDIEELKSEFRKSRQQSQVVLHQIHPHGNVNVLSKQSKLKATHVVGDDDQTLCSGKRQKVKSGNEEHSVEDPGRRLNWYKQASSSSGHLKPFTLCAGSVMESKLTSKSIVQIAKNNANSAPPTLSYVGRSRMVTSLAHVDPYWDMFNDPPADESSDFDQWIEGDGPPELIRLPLLEGNRNWFKLLMSRNEWLDSWHIDSWCYYLNIRTSDQFEGKSTITVVPTPFSCALMSAYQEFICNKDSFQFNPKSKVFDYLFGKDGKISWRGIEKVLMPITSRRNHWLLLGIHLLEKAVYTYNSISGRHTADSDVRKVASLLPILLKQAEKDTEANSLTCLCPNPWTVKSVDVPQQDPTSGDCGVYVMMFMEAIMCGADIIECNAAKVKHYRRRVCRLIYSMSNCEQ